MKKSILVIVLWSISITGCNKGKDAAQPATPNYPQIKPHTTGAKGDDDDTPIVLEVTTDANGKPISGSVVTFTKGQDTLTGITGTSGGVLFTLPRPCKWNLSIVNSGSAQGQGYVSINTKVDIVDSFTQRTDTLLPAQ